MSRDMPGSLFSHRVLFYRDADEFLAGTVPYIRGALESGEAALVAVRGTGTKALKAELGADASEVGFVDMERLGRNPARIISFWRDFVERHSGGGRPVRGVGEPVWFGRTPDELDECHRHERLLNLAFAEAPAWSLLCPYDSTLLGFDVLQAAARCHPFVAVGDSGRTNPAYAAIGPESAPPFAGTLPPPPRGAEMLEFDRSGLQRVRGHVAAQAALAQLSLSRGSDLVSAANELAANSVLHGGGRGRLSSWRDGDDLVVEVEDAGRIEQPLAGRLRPRPAQSGGRGLWLANQLCDLVQIRSGPGGSRVRLRIGLR